jgi:hypothetical protein
MHREMSHSSMSSSTTPPPAAHGVGVESPVAVVRVTCIFTDTAPLTVLPSYHSSASLLSPPSSYNEKLTTDRIPEREE